MLKSSADAIITASKRAIQKTAEATAHLIGNKIADKITSAFDDASNQPSKFRTKYCVQINDESIGTYNANSQINLKLQC